MRRRSDLTIEEILRRRGREAARGRGWLALVVSLLVAGMVGYLTLGVILGVSGVHGASMEPYVEDGDIAVFHRLGEYTAGDIVVLRPPEGSNYLIKRVIAMAGDTVDIDEAAGSVLVNGRTLEEPYAHAATQVRPDDVSFPYRVPEGGVFLLGDNRAESKDSREFGAVGADRIAGRVIMILRVT